MIRAYTHIILLKATLFLAVLLSGAACDQTFEPLQENDRFIYSIYGFIDASADTQWVRVMPVRDSLFLEPEPIDATVTLEHLGGSGKSAVMKDSLFRYGRNAYAYNFWSTMHLEPEESYRLEVKRSDGMSSSVTVTLPPDFPTPFIEVPEGENQEILHIEEVRNLADIQSTHHIKRLQSGQTSVFSFSHLRDTLFIRDPEPGMHEARMNPGEAIEFLDFYNDRQPVEVLKSEIFVASAGPDWLYFPSIDELVIALPDGISNVENGVGYMVGIVSKTIPWRITCFDRVKEKVPCPFAPPAD